MKNLLLIIITASIAFGGIAQETKRPGYMAYSSTFKFEESKTNIPMQGYYILKDGTEIDAIITYQKPEFFVGDFAAGASLVICKALTDKPMDIFNPDNEPNFKEYIEKDKLKAFFIDGHLYANIEKTGWRIVLSEGAIHDFIQIVKSTQNGNDHYSAFRRKQWFQDKPLGSVFSPISNEDYVAMLEKTPPTVTAGKTPDAIVADYKANRISINEAEVRYNVWFNNNSEMQIDYILGENGLTQKDGAVEDAKNKAAEDKKENEEHLNSQFEAGQNASQASKQDPFRGRTMEVDPSMASAKPEVKVKKEKFAGRINRIKADGNKVGVVVLCSNIDVNPPSHTIFSNQKTQPVKGSYKPIEGIEKIGATAVEAFNKGFGTDVFELVDMKDIPYMDDGNGGKEDNWWATKYKVIIFYKYNPYYTAYVQTTGEAPNEKKEFKGQMYVKSFINVMAAEEGENKLKSAGRTPKAASYASDAFLGDPSLKIYMIQDLKKLINPLPDEKIMEHLLKFQSDNNAKFINKNKK